MVDRFYHKVTPARIMKGSISMIQCLSSHIANKSREKLDIDSVMLEHKIAVQNWVTTFETQGSNKSSNIEVFLTVR